MEFWPEIRTVIVDVIGVRNRDGTVKAVGDSDLNTIAKRSVVQSRFWSMLYLAAREVLLKPTRLSFLPYEVHA